MNKKGCFCFWILKGKMEEAGTCLLVLMSPWGLFFCGFMKGAKNNFGLLSLVKDISLFNLSEFNF